MLYLGAILHEPGCDLENRSRLVRDHTRESEDGQTHHFTDATAPASDQHDFTVDTEEILKVEGGHGYGFQKRFGCWDQPSVRGIWQKPIPVMAKHVRNHRAEAKRQAPTALCLLAVLILTSLGLRTGEDFGYRQADIATPRLFLLSRRGGDCKRRSLGCFFP